MPNAVAEIDKERVEQLKKLFAAEYPRMLQSLFDNTTGYTAEIKQCLNNDNLSRAREIAHKMKSSSGQFGLITIQKLAESIERSETDDKAALLKRCDDIETVLKDSRRIITELGLDR